MIKRLILGVFGAAMLLGSVSAAAEESSDPLVLAPDKYTKLFENERVRVAEVRIKSGESIPMHSHPDHFVYVISGGTVNLSHPDGTSADVALAPGQVLWIPAESHATVNTGSTEVRLVVSELKP